MADYDRALAFDPSHADAYCERGLTRLRQGADGEAEKDFTRCLALNSSLKASLARLIRETKAQMAAYALDKK